MRDNKLPDLAAVVFGDTPAPAAAVEATDETMNKLTAILREYFGDAKPLVISKASVLETDFDADSLDIVEFTMEVEDRFEIDIPDEDAERFKTVGDVAAYIDGRK